MQTEKDAEIVGWVGRVGVAGTEHVMAPALLAKEHGTCSVVGRCSSVLRCGQGRAFGLAPAGPPLSGLA